jgi:DNA primase large subunit
MSIDWQQVVTTVVATVGGGGVVLACAAWLVKAIVTNRMARDAEMFRTRLQTDANTEIEKLRHSLQMATLEHQVRFSKLHEKRAEVIAEVYGLLVELHRLGEWFALNDAFSDAPRHSESFENVSAAGRKLFLFVQMNRLYLPESVCTSVETFAQAVTKEVLHVRAGSMIETRVIGTQTVEPSEKEREFRTKTFNKAWEVFDKDIPAARKLLENEFRELLGGTENSVSRLTRREESEAIERS